MSLFETYLTLGAEHIADYTAYDHILFVVALTVVYTIRDWKRVLILVTAFTVGHSLTLALAAKEVVSVNTSLIEFLIPVTIFITAVSNIFGSSGEGRSALWRYYGFAGAFGLIHGLGFSNYLRSIMGTEENFLTALFAFNVGLELGQLLIVGLTVAATYLAVNSAGVPQRWWVSIVSGLVASVALKLMYETGQALSF